MIVARFHSASKSIGDSVKKSTMFGGVARSSIEKTTMFFSSIHSRRFSASAKSKAATGTCGEKPADVITVYEHLQMAGKVEDSGGLTYLNQISDANVGAGLHIEPGIWAAVPATTDPKVVPTVCRLASIPHGTVVLLQGTAVTTNGGPNIAVKGIKPFGIGGPPTQTIDFPEQTLTNHTNFRTSGAGLTGITQQMVNNPNSVLTKAIAGQHITSTTTLHVTTIDLPTPGGGTANTAFLKGGADGPNATAVQVTATFWLETLQGQSAPTQLQYTQTVLLNFNGISWPHVTVATLRKQ